MFCLDLETAGLYPAEADGNDFITCIGVASQYGVRQFSAEAGLFRASPYEAENLLLKRFIKTANDSDSIISGQSFFTYNGIAFDLPFLQTRLLYHNFPEFDPINIFCDYEHYDLSLFSKYLNNNRYISKDEFCRKYGNLYIPSTLSGAYLSRIYKNQTVTDDEHIDMLQHNAIDLAATYKVATKQSAYSDFKTFYEKVLSKN